MKIDKIKERREKMLRELEDLEQQEQETRKKVAKPVIEKVTNVTQEELRKILEDEDAFEKVTSARLLKGDLAAAMRVALEQFFDIEGAQEEDTEKSEDQKPVSRKAPGPAPVEATDAADEGTGEKARGGFFSAS